MNNPIFENELYSVLVTGAAMNEAGTANDAPGYAVVNRDTGIHEYTSTILGNALFQAAAFNRMVTSFLAPDENDAETVLGSVEDVTVN